jgi:hypothetical protein
MSRTTLAAVLASAATLVLAGAAVAADRDDKGTVVDAPTTKVETGRGRTEVEAPFTDVETGGGETHIRAPFVDIDVPSGD